MKLASIKRKPRRPLWPFRRRDEARDLGSRGERIAVQFLKRRKHKIIARNFWCKLGELDIVSADGVTLVFVEIKTRSSTDLQDPQEAAPPVKWRRVERAARVFLARHAKVDQPCRFDLITVVLPPRGSPIIEHFEDAYQPGRSGKRMF